MKDRVLDNPAVTQMLDDNALQQGRRHPGVPNAVWVDDDDWATAANPQTWCFSALDAGRTKKEPFPAKEVWKHAIQNPPALFGRAKPSGADDDVPGEGLHARHGRIKTIHIAVS